MGNVKIYDEGNFDIQIEIKSDINEPIEFDDYREKGNTLVLDKYDRIIFTDKTNFIYVTEIIYPNKYNIIQKIPFEKTHFWLFVYEKYLIAGYYNYEFNVYVYNTNMKRLIIKTL